MTLGPDRVAAGRAALDLARVREWQREQIAREDSLGFGAADPALPPPAA